MNWNLTTIQLSAAQVALVLGTVIPFGTAVLTKLGARLHVKSAVVAVLAALTAVAGGLAGAGGTVTLGKLLVAFVAALVGAGGSRVSLTSQYADAVAVKTSGFGLGKRVVAAERRRPDVPLAPQVPMPKP